jgi:hypothetical protein
LPIIIGDELDVKGISNNNANLQSIYETRKHDTPGAADADKKGDTLEISNGARELKVNKPEKDLTAVLQKINDNFYNSDKVISATADAILRDLKFE